MNIRESQWLTVGLNKDTEDFMQNETNVCACNTGGSKWEDRFIYIESRSQRVKMQRKLLFL